MVRLSVDGLVYSAMTQIFKMCIKARSIGFEDRVPFTIGIRKDKKDRETPNR